MGDIRHLISDVSKSDVSKSLSLKVSALSSMRYCHGCMDFYRNL